MYLLTLSLSCIVTVLVGRLATILIFALTCALKKSWPGSIVDFYLDWISTSLFIGFQFRSFFMGFADLLLLDSSSDLSLLDPQIFIIGLLQIFPYRIPRSHLSLLDAKIFFYRIPIADLSLLIHSSLYACMCISYFDM